MPAAPIMGFTLFLRKRLRNFANSTPPAVSNMNATRPSAIIASVSAVTKSSAFILNATDMPSSSVTRLARDFCAVSLRLPSTPHSLIRLPNMRKPISSALLGAMVPATTVTNIGNSTRVVPDTALGLYGMRMQRSFLLVSIFITGGCIMGTSAMYEYAATIMGP